MRVPRWTRSLRVLTLPALLSGAAAVSGCDVCAGTPSCHNPPEASAGGQFIEHKSGTPVGGVFVEFVRTGGASTVADTVRAFSNSDGFFQLRVGAINDGAVVGDLRVIPPEPHAAYVVRGVSLRTSRTRGDGGYLGRLVVNPYLVLVGDVFDRRSGARLEGVTVELRRVGGVDVEPDAMTFTSDRDGRFAWIDPPVSGYGSFRAEITLTAPGRPRSYRVVRDVALSYIDAEIRFLPLYVGSGLGFAGQVVRRGNNAPMPGVPVEFRRTAGMTLPSDPVSLTTDGGGYFSTDIDPGAEGRVIGDVIVTPPAPFPAESRRDVALWTSDDIFPRWVGTIGVGAAVHFGAYFRFRATDAPLPERMIVEVLPKGGVQPEISPGDAGWRALAANGRLAYAAPTPDAGTVTFDLVARLDAPFLHDTIRNVPVPARYADGPLEIGAFRVGSWYPWTGRVVDAVTDQPIAGASITLRRTGGATLEQEIFRATSAADGTFPLRPVPRERGTLVADLAISAGAGYRDTTVAGLQLRTTEDDTVRSVGIFRLSRP